MIEIPETSGISVGQPTKELIAERGEEVAPIASLPPVPNPNDLVGASMYQAHAISRVGTSNKKWVNRTGILIFGVIPVVLMEAVSIGVWVSKGKWTAFVITNVVLAFILGRKGKSPK